MKNAEKIAHQRHGVWATPQGRGFLLSDMDNHMGRLSGLPKAIPTGREGGRRTIAAVTRGASVGQVRTLLPDSEGEWIVGDTSEAATGVVVNDYVENGDRVWSPQRGDFIIDLIREQNGVITGVMPRGAHDWVEVWYRVTPHEIESPVMVGDLVVIESAVHGRGEGEVGTVTQVIPDSRHVEVAAPTPDSLIEAISYIVVQRHNDTFPEEGALIRPHSFLAGATEEYKAGARRTVGEAIGSAGGWLRAQFHRQIAGMSSPHETRISNWTVVGHRDSIHAHKIDGWQAQEGPTSPPTAEVVDGSTEAALRREITAWQERWDALWAGLTEKAEEHGWCGEYDEFAQEHGGPGRAREYTFQVTMVTEIDTTLNLDEALKPFLNSDGRRPDISQAVRVEHDTVVDFSMAENGDSGERAERVERALIAAGWKYDSFEIRDWYES